MASQNWQYNKTVISSLLGNDELNELGNEGWELVAMSSRLWVGGTTETTPLSATDTYVLRHSREITRLCSPDVTPCAHAVSAATPRGIRRG